MFTLTIETDNAAFEDVPAREVARILRRIAKRLEDNEILDDGKVLDVNGNTVGRYEFTA